MICKFQVINCAQLVLKENSSNTSSNVRSAFKDARLMDAILVFDDFQVQSASLYYLITYYMYPIFFYLLVHINSVIQLKWFLNFFADIKL